MATKQTEGASVIACLHQLWPDFQLSNANQMNPTSDIAIKFYERFICGQLQIEIDDLEQTLKAHASYEDAFADILSIYTLYMCTATVIQKLGLNELFQSFGLTDILSPMRKKFKMSLILLSNCVIYVTGLQEFMEEVKNKVCEALQSTKDIHMKIDELKERKNNAVILHTKNTQKIEDMRKRKDSLLKQIRSVQKELERNKEETKSQETELSHNQDAYEILEAKLNSLLVIEEKLKSDIVDDYQTIACEKERLIKEKNELSTESDEYVDMMNQKMQTISRYQENFNYIHQFLETIPLSKLLETNEMLHKYDSEIEQHKNEIKSMQETECLDQAALKQIQSVNDSLKQKIKASIVTNENIMKNSDQKIEDLQNEIKQEHDKMSKSIEFNDKLEKKIQKYEERSQYYEELIKKQNTYYDEKYKEILELKGQLDKKVMALIDTVEHELSSKKK